MSINNAAAERHANNNAAAGRHDYSGGRLRCKELSHSFPTRGTDEKRPVLENISLDIQAGEFVCIVGASGSGKTTLLRMLAGLIQPDHGVVSFDGTPLKGPSQHLGFVFQSDTLMPWRTVLDNVAIGLELRGVGKTERQASALHALELVGLADWKGHFPAELSGGMRQRVNIARAIAIEPAVLLMDEPFAALDAQTREIMQSELLEIYQKTKVTVAFVTHQIEEAVFLADRIVVLSSSPGRVKQIVSPPFERPRSEAIKRTAQFAETVDEVWQMIADDVRAGIKKELTAH